MDVQMTRRVTVEVYATSSQVQALRDRLDVHARDFLPDANARTTIERPLWASARARELPVSPEVAAAGVHKASPADDEAAVTSCVVCKELVRAVPGGQGRTWVHDATGLVAGGRR